MKKITFFTVSLLLEILFIYTLNMWSPAVKDGHFLMPWFMVIGAFVGIFWLADWEAGGELIGIRGSLASLMGIALIMILFVGYPRVQEPLFFLSCFAAGDAISLTLLRIVWNLIMLRKKIIN